MSTYEERMAEKYGFFSKDDVPENKKINEDVSNEGELNIEEEEVVVENTSSDNLLVPMRLRIRENTLWSGVLSVKPKLQNHFAAVFSRIYLSSSLSDISSINCKTRHLNRRAAPYPLYAASFSMLFNDFSISEKSKTLLNCLY